jgi:hypothetical protein
MNAGVPGAAAPNKIVILAAVTEYADTEMRVGAKTSTSGPQAKEHKTMPRRAL